VNSKGGGGSRWNSRPYQPRGSRPRSARRGAAQACAVAAHRAGRGARHGSDLRLRARANVPAACGVCALDLHGDAHAVDALVRAAEPAGRPALRESGQAARRPPQPEIFEVGRMGWEIVCEGAAARRRCCVRRGADGEGPGRRGCSRFSVHSHGLTGSSGGATSSHRLRSSSRRRGWRCMRCSRG
jgi:hypothetical protein